MQPLTVAAIASVAGGMTIEKYDETTKELFENVRAKLHNNLARLDKLESLIKGGYAGLGNPVPVQDEL